MTGQASLIIFRLISRTTLWETLYRRMPARARAAQAGYHPERTRPCRVRTTVFAAVRPEAKMKPPRQQLLQDWLEHRPETGVSA